MKALIRIPFALIIVICCVFLSCNKQDDLSNNDIGTLQPKSGEIFTVSPSGNYEDDSYNIQTALNNAVASGPGCTVQLTAGIFYLKYKIEIDGFDGFFKGAGKQITIMTTHDQIDYYADPYGDNFCLITFRHGYVRMSDLTFNITEPEPCITEFENALPTIIMVSGSRSETPPEGDQCGSSIFNNIEFICNAGNFFGYNVAGFLYIGADRTEFIIGGNQKITKCLFQGSVNSLTNWGDNDATWLIGGNGANGNIFSNAYWPLTLGECNNSSFEVSFNNFEDFKWGGVFITQGYFTDASSKTVSTFLIQQNQISTEEECDGISILDYTNYSGFGKSIDAIIKSNQISMNAEGYWGGIYGVAADDIIIKNNNIWGNGMSAIYGGIWGDETTNWFMQGNNVQNVDALAAPIWLGEATSYCTVIGGSNKTNVFDQGTNNILTGVTKIQGNDLGQESQEAHELMQELMQQFKNH